MYCYRRHKFAVKSLLCLQYNHKYSIFNLNNNLFIIIIIIYRMPLVLHNWTVLQYPFVVMLYCTVNCCVSPYVFYLWFHNVLILLTVTCGSTIRTERIVAFPFQTIDHTKLPTWCTEYYLFVKYYYSPLHVSSIKYSSSGGHSCIQAAYGTVTLYKSSWWPVDLYINYQLDALTIIYS